MFNSPFGSFQDTVAEAKEEREQLDRLLTISTPRERLLVGAVALLLPVLLAWFCFGSVTRSVAVDGMLVVSGEPPPATARTVQALVWVAGDVPRLEAGMPAEAELAGADGEPVLLAGVITAVAAVPWFEGLAAFASTAPVSAYRMDIALGADRDLAPLAGRRCRVRVVTGKQSPFEFFRMR